VVVEHGGSGSKAAAPIATDIMRETLLKDPSAKPVFSAARTRLAQGRAEGEPPA
jgi:penicillin-binding protein 2